MQGHWRWYRDADAQPPFDADLIRHSIRIERRYTARAGQAAPAGVSTVNVLEGWRRVIVTAPHASEVFRDGAYRYSDGGGTGALAEMLHTLAGATALTTNYRFPSDPNSADDNAFKSTLRELILRHDPVLLLDIHGSHPRRPYDVDFGTMYQASLLNHTELLPTLERALQEAGLRRFSHDYFCAATQQTVTKLASKLGVPAIQLEVNSLWLHPSRGNEPAHRFARLLLGLTQYLCAKSGVPKPVLPR